MVALEPITPDNYAEACALTVRPEQQRFVGSVLRSLADAYVYTGAVPLLGRADELAVGFVLLYPFEHEGEPVVSIVRLLIDRGHQGQGWGRQLLDATLAKVPTFEPLPQRVKIGCLPENTIALDLYRSVGFVADGTEEDGQIILWRSAVERTASG